MYKFILDYAYQEDTFILSASETFYIESYDIIEAAKKAEVFSHENHCCFISLTFDGFECEVM